MKKKHKIVMIEYKEIPQIQNNKVIPIHNTSIIFGDNTSLNTNKEYSELILNKMINQFIQNISYKDAMKIIDNEGYIQCARFGKIHINNWIESKS